MKDLADFAVKKAISLGASYADARADHSIGNGVSLKNDIPESSGFADSKGIGIRVLVNGASGFSSINKLDKKKIEEVVKKLIKSVKYSSKLIKKPIEFSTEVKEKYKYFIKPKIDSESISLAEKIKNLLEINSALKEVKGFKSSYISQNDSYIESYFVNSENIKISSKIPFIGIYYVLTLREKGKSSQIYKQLGETKGYDAFHKWDLTKLAIGETKEMLKNLKTGIKTPKKKMDVVVSPDIVGIMVHESVGHPYEADRILGREAAQAGESFVNTDMIGSRIGSKIVDVVDNPVIPGSAGFYKYDDEGVKARKKYLIKKGIINELLHNRETAAKLDVKSNGSARAVGFSFEPIVRMSNTYMLPKDHTKDELIEGVKQGIYFKSYMEWNIDDKRMNQKYTGNIAYLIKNGRLTKPVRNPVIEIKTTELYNAVDAVGKDLGFMAGTCGKGEPMQGIPVSMGGPHIRLKDIRVH